MTTLSPQHGEANYHNGSPLSTSTHPHTHTHTHIHTHPHTHISTHIHITHTPQGTHAEWHYGVILKQKELCQILQTDLQGGGSPGAIQSDLDPPVRP